jgi:hypothetical protein
MSSTDPREFHMKKRLLASLATIAALGLMAPASSDAANAFGASCVVGGNSTFTATTAGTYGWTWRTGMAVNGYSYRRLSAGESVSVATPGAASTSTLFGVVSSKSTNYSYVTCTNPG